MNAAYDEMVLAEIKDRISSVYERATNWMKRK